MKRRKMLAGLGSLAAGGAAAMGTGAFSTVWINRDLEAQIVADSNAYLGLEDTSVYAKTVGNKLALDFAGGTFGQNGDGLNEDANSRFFNTFRIVNQGTNKVSIAASDDPSTVDTWDSSGLALKWTDDKVDESGGAGLVEEDVMHDVDDINDPGQTVVKDLPRLPPGEDIWVHPHFFLGPHNASNTIANDVPDRIGFYATRTVLGGVDQTDGNLE